MGHVKAYGYLRVSSKGQVNGHGLDRQEETIRSYAKGAGVELVAFFRDAHTGTEAIRPGFEEMLLAVLSNGVRTIIVESLDRLARDLMVQTRLLAELQSRGVALISATTGETVTDLAGDPMREAMVQVQGVFAQLDKRLLVRKLRKAREAKREATGRCEGRKPFGTKEGEAPVIEKILSLRRAARGRERMSFEKIADQLNAEAVPTRAGGAWKPGTVFAIVKAQRPNLTARA